MPTRDAYDLGDRPAEAACAALDPVVSPELLAAHHADLRHGEAQQVAQLAEFDVAFIARIGEPAIGDAMVTLLADLPDLLAGVATDERPSQNSAAPPTPAAGNGQGNPSAQRARTSYVRGLADRQAC
ncbi:hypothetical protein AB0I49_37890 [Streptomyces sp. NPDC050617]|uniref:hypothetical protein n=1 Tax=Streptomyces sp. NPDC050617 TaxID=3154628 RepID=UPI00343D0057